MNKVKIMVMIFELFIIILRIYYGIDFVLKTYKYLIFIILSVIIYKHKNIKSFKDFVNLLKLLIDICFIIGSIVYGIEFLYNKISTIENINIYFAYGLIVFLIVNPINKMNNNNV